MHGYLKTVRFLTCVLCLVASLTLGARAEPILSAIRGIESDLGARVGFYMHDLHTNNVITYAPDDPFPLNSTFKLLACGALLSRVEKGMTNLSQLIPLKDIRVVNYSPAIAHRIETGHLEISFNDACQMMLSVSDNTAANIVLKEIGGPTGLTTFLRSIGDQATRLDRWETALNEALPGDLRDTTTPRAIANSLQRLILGDVLTPASQTILRKWLADHSVADALFRAALPVTWSIDDRSGAGGYGSRSIIAVIYPEGRRPIIATLFITETDADFNSRNRAIARVGEAIVTSVMRE